MRVAAAALAAATALGACAGGGDGDGDGDSAGNGGASAAGLVLKTSDPAEASRFLTQAGFAATDEGITEVLDKGFDGWLERQFVIPQGRSRWDELLAQGYMNVDKKVGGNNALHPPLWKRLIAAPDELRQRVALALSEIVVLSQMGTPGNYRTPRVAGYMDLLENKTFSTFRELIEAVTLNPAMGGYLNMLGNQKENIATGRRPDENYAREVMQLFTIGLVQLNPDGTAKRDAGGVPIETYGQQDVTELARLLTGWDLDAAPLDGNTETLRRPMKLIPARHAVGPKAFLGKTVQDGDGNVELQRAIDVLTTHPNNAPFFGAQLIQRLVTSNPSPAYVARVSAAFENNGSGVRGDLKSVIRAVLLDPEARARGTGPDDGRLREPMVRFIQWARTFRASSAADDWTIGDLSSSSTELGQSPLVSPSVFNFYRPGYVPPNTEIAQFGKVAPEFQIANESSVVGYVNYMQVAIDKGVGGTAANRSVVPDYSRELALVNDPAALVSRLNRLLASDQLDAPSAERIRAAIATMPVGTDAQRSQRVKAAILMVMVSPQYLVQK